MQHVAIDGKQEFLAQLREQLAKRLPQEKVEAVTTFAEAFYASAPLEDLIERHLDDTYGATLMTWHFIQHHDPRSPKVHVYNPDFEEHGWQSSHTLIEVLHEDMPFLVDSVRIELNRRGITVHAIHNAVLAVERDRQHRLKRTASPRDKDAPQGRESIMVIEIDRHSDAPVLEDLEASLRDVLTDVRTAVEDFEPMLARVGEALEEIKAIFSSPFLDVSSRLCLTASASLSRCPSSCLLLTSLSSGLSRDKERKRNVLLPQNFLRLVREQWNAGLGEITRAHMGALARDVQPLDLMGVRERALPDEQFSEVLQTVSDSDNCTNSSSSGLLSSMPCSAFFLICRKHCRFKSIGVSQALRTDALLDHEPLDPHSLATSDLPRHAALAPQEHSRNG